MRKTIVLVFLATFGHSAAGLSLPLAAATNPRPDQSEVEKCLELCRQEIQRGRADEAVAWAEKAIALEPANAPAHFQLAQAYNLKQQQASGLGRLGPAKKYKAALEKAVELDPGFLRARQELMNYLLQAPGIAGGSVEKAKIQAAEIAKLDEKAGYRARAAVFQAEKEWDKAEAELKSLLALDSQDFESVAYLAAFYQNRKDLGKAAATFQAYLDAHPKDSAAHLSLGQSYVLAQRFDRAKEIFEGGLALGDDGRDFHYQLGRLAALSGQNLEAGLDHLKKYLEVPPPPGRPTHADAWWRMGNIYEKMSRKEDAAAAYRKALEINPDHNNAKGSLKALDK